jgi:uncharacterized protein (DUF952 family)
MTAAVVYKICSAGEWAEAEAAGAFIGSPVDLADGYIHFSTAAQTPETLRRHFAGRDGLVLVAVDAAALGSALRWEPSRGGDLFPHLYAPLPVTAALSVTAIETDGAGGHAVPGLAP